MSNEFKYESKDDNNEYVNALLHPFQAGNGVFIPDNKGVLSATKISNMSLNVTGSSTLVVMYRPFKARDRLTWGIMIIDPATGRSIPGWKGVVPEDANLFDTYSQARLVSGGVRVWCSTVTTTNSNLQGQYSAAVLYDRITRDDFLPSTLTGFNGAKAIANASLFSECIMLALPVEVPSYFAMSGTTIDPSGSCTVYSVHESSSASKFFTGANILPGTSFPGTMPNGLIMSLDPDATGEIVGLDGYFSVTVNWQKQLFAAFAGVNTAGVLSATMVVTAKYLDHAGVEQDCKYIGSISSRGFKDNIPLYAVGPGVYQSMELNQEVLFYSPFPIYRIKAHIYSQAVTNGPAGDFLNSNPNAPWSASCVIQAWDYNSLSKQCPTMIMNASGVDANATVSLQGRHAYEVIPDAKLSRDLALTPRRVVNIQDFQHALRFCAKCPPINTALDYLSISRISVNREAVATAGFFDDLWSGVKKVGSAVITATKPFAPQIIRGIGRELGFASSSGMLKYQGSDGAYEGASPDEVYHSSSVDSTVTDWYRKQSLAGQDISQDDLTYHEHIIHYGVRNLFSSITEMSEWAQSVFPPEGKGELTAGLKEWDEKKPAGLTTDQLNPLKSASSLDPDDLTQHARHPKGNLHQFFKSCVAALLYGLPGRRIASFVVMQALRGRPVRPELMKYYGASYTSVPVKRASAYAWLFAAAGDFSQFTKAYASFGGDSQELREAIQLVDASEHPTVIENYNKTKDQIVAEFDRLHNERASLGHAASKPMLESRPPRRPDYLKELDEEALSVGGWEAPPARKLRFMHVDAFDKENLATWRLGYASISPSLRGMLLEDAIDAVFGGQVHATLDLYSEPQDIILLGAKKGDPVYLPDRILWNAIKVRREKLGADNNHHEELARVLLQMVMQEAHSHGDCKREIDINYAGDKPTYKITARSCGITMCRAKPRPDTVKVLQLGVMARAVNAYAGSTSAEVGHASSSSGAPAFPGPGSPLLGLPGPQRSGMTLEESLIDVKQAREKYYASDAKPSFTSVRAAGFQNQLKVAAFPRVLRDAEGVAVSRSLIVISRSPLGVAGTSPGYRPLTSEPNIRLCQGVTVGFRLHVQGLQSQSEERAATERFEGMIASIPLILKSTGIKFHPGNPVFITATDLVAPILAKDGNPNVRHVFPMVAGDSFLAALWVAASGISTGMVMTGSVTFAGDHPLCFADVGDIIPKVLGLGPKTTGIMVPATPYTITELARKGIPFLTSSSIVSGMDHTGAVLTSFTPMDILGLIYWKNSRDTFTEAKMQQVSDLELLPDILPFEFSTGKGEAKVKHESQVTKADLTAFLETMVKRIRNETDPNKVVYRDFLEDVKGGRPVSRKMAAAIARTREAETKAVKKGPPKKKGIKEYSYEEEEAGSGVRKDEY